MFAVFGAGDLLAGASLQSRGLIYGRWHWSWLSVLVGAAERVVSIIVSCRLKHPSSGPSSFS